MKKCQICGHMNENFEEECEMCGTELAYEEHVHIARTVGWTCPECGRVNLKDECQCGKERDE